MLGLELLLLQLNTSVAKKYNGLHNLVRFGHQLLGRWHVSCKIHRGKSNNNSFYLKVFCHFINIGQYEIENVIKIVGILETVESGLLIVPQVGHDSLDEHVLVVRGVCS